MSKILILVIASRNKIYDELINKYWHYLIKRANKLKNVEVYLLFGQTDTSNLRINKKNILCYKNIPETYIPGIFNKTIKAIEDIGAGYDMIFRTNLSSFLILENLITIAENYSTDMVYSAVPVKIRCNLNNTPPSYFGSGCGFFMSKKVGLLLIDRAKQLTDIMSPDDVLIGSILNDIPIIENKRYNIQKNVEYLTKSQLTKHHKKIIAGNFFHVRIKNTSDRNIDLQIVKYLTKYFYRNKQKQVKNKNLIDSEK